MPEYPAPYPLALPLHPPGDEGAAPPRPALSLTLPGDPRSASVARAAVTAALQVHGLTAYLWPAVAVAAEMVTVAARATPGRDLYLALRHRDDALRLLVWDQHSPNPPCMARRRRALWLLAAVVDDWGGEWGVRDGLPGSKAWAVLPR
ncbi:ATP-binding protein [Streptomyces sp. NPDC058330]|uniref:ATP-binding protein n=1 Tax=Streptomyces sp. NPDC058330 TaxID=3346449 RepID=UPI0036EF0A03